MHWEYFPNTRMKESEPNPIPLPPPGPPEFISSAQTFGNG